MPARKKSDRAKSALKTKTSDDTTVYRIDESEHLEIALYVRNVAKHVDETSILVEAQSSELDKVNTSLDQIQTNLLETTQIVEASARACTRVSEIELQSLEAMARARELYSAAWQHAANSQTYFTVLQRMVTHLDAATVRACLVALDAARVALAAGPQGQVFRGIAQQNMHFAEMLLELCTDMKEVLAATQTEVHEGLEANEQGDAAAREAMSILVDDDSTLEGVTQHWEQVAQLCGSSARETVTQARSLQAVFDKFASMAENIQEMASLTATHVRWLGQTFSAQDK